MEIYYIAGAGRSGSTLLDISLGNLKNHQSLGELIFFVKNGLIDNEYCSCGLPVQDCSFWKEIEKEWALKRKLTIRTYQKTQMELLRNKNTFKNIYYRFFPTKQHQAYFNDLKALYEIIFEKSGQHILIDSSKNAQYILILRRLPFKVKVLHLTRSFSGVLQSTKKEFKKNPKQGLERALKPQSFRYSLAIWTLDNVFTRLFSTGMRYKRVKYEDLVKKPAEVINRLSQLNAQEAKLFEKRGPLLAEHLVAGNQLRMGTDIFIQTSKPLKVENRLTTLEKSIVSFIDFFY